MYIFISVVYIDQLTGCMLKCKLEHSFRYFPLCKPCIIREQCMLWRHAVCNYILKQSKHRKLCFVQLYSTVWRHFVFKLHKRTQIRFVLRFGSLKTQWRHTVLYNWTKYIFLCFSCLLNSGCFYDIKICNRQHSVQPLIKVIGCII